MLRLTAEWALILSPRKEGRSHNIVLRLPYGVPQVGSLHQEQVIVSQFLRLDIQDQGMGCFLVRVSMEGSVPDLSP